MSEIPESVALELQRTLARRKRDLDQQREWAEEAERQAKFAWDAVRQKDDAFTEMYVFVRHLGVEIPEEVR